MRRPHQLTSSFPCSLTLIHCLFDVAVWAHACLLAMTHMRWSCSGSSDGDQQFWCLLSSEFICLLQALWMSQHWETLINRQFESGVLELESFSFLVRCDSNMPFSFLQAAAYSASELWKFHYNCRETSFCAGSSSPSTFCCQLGHLLSITLALDSSSSQGYRRAWPTSCFYGVFPVIRLLPWRPFCAGSFSEL